MSTMRGLSSWLTSLRQPTFVPIESITANAHLGSVADDIAELLSPALSSQPRGMAELARLLRNDEVALVRGKRPDQFRAFDGWGRCIAVAPRDAVAVGWASKNRSIHFIDCGGLSFSAETYSSVRTTVFSGATAAYVRQPPSHEVVGQCDTRSADLANPTYDGVLASWHKDTSNATVAHLRAPDGTPIGRRTPINLPLFFTPRDGWKSTPTPIVLRFERDADEPTRATALALEVCRFVQWEKDSNIG